MLDHIILTVRNFKEATAFYEAVLPHLNIQERHDYDGKNGPPGHPDLKGFGADGRLFLWLREVSQSPVPSSPVPSSPVPVSPASGAAAPLGSATHIGFVAANRQQVDAAYSAAM